MMLVDGLSKRMLFRMIPKGICLCACALQVLLASLFGGFSTCLFRKTQVFTLILLVGGYRVFSFKKNHAMMIPLTSFTRKMWVKSATCSGRWQWLTTAKCRCRWNCFRLVGESSRGRLPEIWPGGLDWPSKNGLCIEFYWDMVGYMTIMRPHNDLTVDDGL